MVGIVNVDGGWGWGYGWGGKENHRCNYLLQDQMILVGLPENQICEINYLVASLKSDRFEGRYHQCRYMIEGNDTR